MVMGNKYNGFCIDIWSSGIILYAMLCGYLPFEEMENDEYNEVLFRNIVECNVDYPNEYITPVAKDLLCKILVKDPKKRITIDEIKTHNFYLLGELLYNQTFENKNNINEFLIISDENEKYIDFEDLRDSDKNDINIINNNNLNLEEKVIINEDIFENEKNIMIEEQINDEKEIEEIKDIKETKETKDIKDIKEINNLSKEISNNNNYLLKEQINITPLKSEKKEESKNSNNSHSNGKNKNKTEKNNENNNNRENILDKIKLILTEQNKKEKKEESQNKINNNNKNRNKNNESKNKNKNSSKKEKAKDLSKPKDEIKKHSIKQLSLETYHNIKMPTSNNEKINKLNLLQNSLNTKKCKTNKDEKSQKEYSIQEEYSNNNNKNSNEINFKNQYLKTEIYPSNSKNKTKTKKSHYQCKLLNKKLVNNNRIAFDNILKSLQNKNNIKNKTPKRYSTKKNIPIKQNSNNSNSISKKKYCSYSPGIRKVGKNGKNIMNNLEQNINFPKQNNYLLTTHNNIKNSYNLLSDNILKGFNTKICFNNNNKYKKPHKRFAQKKNANINYINSINNDNYFRTNNNIKTKNNEFFKNSVNNALNIKSFEYCLSSNNSKKKHLVVDKKISNDINLKNNNYNILTNNFNINKNTKNNISKKSFGNLKGNNYINNIFSDNSKPILINTSHIRKNSETLKNKKIKNINNNKNNNKTNPNKNSKSKSKSKKNRSNLLLHKTNNIYNKDNLDNNIIINFNILKPNIILDHQRASSRKPKACKFGLTSNVTHSNNFMSSKIERPITENNFCSTVRNNFFNRSNKNKNYNYKNIDPKQIKKSKEINQIIKSIQEVKKGNINNINNNKKRMNTEI